MAKHRWRCPHCDWRLAMASKASFDAAKCRHMREEHANATSAKEQRRKQQRVRIAALRRGGGAGDVLTGEWRIAVTCPPKREELWSLAFDGLVGAGFPAAAISRRKGIDLNSNTPRRPAALTRSTFLLWDFHTRFLPWALGLFTSAPAIEVVVWAEDDVVLKAGVSAHTLRSEWAQRRAEVCWWGYTRVKGKPHWGSHLFAFSREGARQLRAVLDGQAAAFKGTRDPMGYLCGLDTFLRRLVGTKRRPGTVAVARSSLAGQRTHRWQGRRS